MEAAGDTTTTPPQRLSRSGVSKLLKEGVPTGVAQKILRHGDIKVTEGIYPTSTTRM